MIQIDGIYNIAKVFTESLEEASVDLITALCNHISSEGSQIRIMPDVHAGKGCVIGTTMTLSDRVVPNLVGVDIGCGVLAIKTDATQIDGGVVDSVINSHVPLGFKIRTNQHRFADLTHLDDLVCGDYIQKDKALRSIGTLGGGNHFIEFDKDSDGCIWLLIHSGSRHLGTEVAKYYQDIASNTHPDSCHDLAYLEGHDMNNYIHDIAIVQEFADLNRKAIADEILNGLNLNVVESFCTIHNYVDVEHKILRKGSVSAQDGERLIIPLNMRDGSLICVGKGNPDWNYSAPHGAGRLMSRKDANDNITIDEFKAAMNGIYCSVISRDTISEAPMAYKDASSIKNIIQDTVDIVGHMHPVYNIKG